VTKLVYAVVHTGPRKGTKMANEEEDVNWSAVTGRCLAYLCLKNSEYAKGSILEQAQFLEKLGLPLEDRAGVVGSTSASLYELSRRARSKKGGAKSEPS
jgi:hypothetical protein